MLILSRQYTNPASAACLQIQWQVNGKVLEPSERVDLQTYGNHTTLDIPFSLRSDSGPYRLTLSNELGSDTAQATVTVLGQLDSEAVMQGVRRGGGGYRDIQRWAT